MSRKYFGTDGIRGRANGIITPELALKVGQAAGLVFQRGDHRHRVVIGKDTRLSGYMIETALIAGFTSVGMDVLQLGPMPTPAVAMLTRSMRADIGVMISASHNPFEDNGIKLFGPDGFKLNDDVEREIESLIDGELHRRLAGSRGSRPRQAHRERARPLHRVRQALAAAQRHPRRPAHRGRLRERRGLPRRPRDPVGTRRRGDLDRRRAGRLQHQPRRRLHGAGGPRRQGPRTGADIGIALDGRRRPRLIVDEKGQAVDGDQLMAVVARSWKEDDRLTQPGLVATIMSNLGLERYLGGIGLTMARTAVGDRYVLEHMREHGYNLGGEQSGHIIMFGLRDHRRRLRGGAPAPQRGQARGQAGERGLPLLRAAAAESSRTCATAPASPCVRIRW